jgi:C_GCAxxG_C_C family probable redox protein
MDHSQKAKNNFCDGYNCAQAVILSYCDETGLDKSTALKLTSSLGAGIGGMREVCGAVNAMCMIAGYIYGSDKPLCAANKKAHYERIQELCDKFKEKNGSIICRTLRGLSDSVRPAPEERTSKYYKIRPCADLCADAAEILEQYIKEHPVN